MVSNTEVIFCEGNTSKRLASRCSLGLAGGPSVDSSVNFESDDSAYVPEVQRSNSG